MKHNWAQMAALWSAPTRKYDHLWQSVARTRRLSNINTLIVTDQTISHVQTSYHFQTGCREGTFQ